MAEAEITSGQGAQPDTLPAMSKAKTISERPAGQSEAKASEAGESNACGRPNTVQLLVAAIFTTTGVLHFIAEKFFIAIVPKQLPQPKLLVQLSGVAELMGALGILIPGTRGVAGKGLLALLAAVYPANINMAVNADRFKQIPKWALWARLPLQFVLAALVKRAMRRGSAAGSAGDGEPVASAQA